MQIQWESQQVSPESIIYAHIRVSANISPVNYASAKCCRQQHRSGVVTETPRSQQVLPLLQAIIQAQLHAAPQLQQQGSNAK